MAIRIIFLLLFLCGNVNALTTQMSFINRIDFRDSNNDFVLWLDSGENVAGCTYAGYRKSVNDGQFDRTYQLAMRGMDEKIGVILNVTLGCASGYATINDISLYDDEFAGESEMGQIANLLLVGMMLFGFFAGFRTGLIR